jgi:RNA-directed DNA polymerase
LFNLVYDPAFLVVAWSRVRENKGGRTAGVDGIGATSMSSNRDGVPLGRKEVMIHRRS